MLARDENALACDLAEVYGIVDPEALPVRTLAVLACGLPEHARIMRLMRDDPLTTEQTLLALAVDYLALLAWFQTEDGHKGRNRPGSVLERLRGHDQADGGGQVVYASGEDFLAARARWIKTEDGEDRENGRISAARRTAATTETISDDETEGVRP